MRNLMIVMATVLLVFFSVMKISADGGPKMEFQTMIHNFGTFREGDIVYCKFPFKNTGTAPLVINEVERPCGCLLPLWPKNPIMPGDTGSIGVYFNSKDRPGEFRKTMLVYTNIVQKDQIIIMVKGNADKHFKKHVNSPAK